MNIPSPQSSLNEIGFTDAQIAVMDLLKNEKEMLADGTLKARVQQSLQEDPDLKVRVDNAWSDVESFIMERAAESQPKRLVFEVHHEIETCRNTFIIALDKLGDADQARAIAIKRT